ncbi:MAG: ABC-2 family transporter protein [Spirochaetia bacterium]|nr:ABC-2 family transporter protein [Spirochaetia bacterium]
MFVFYKWAVKSFQRNLAYRLEYFVSLFNALLYIFIFTSIWQALMPENGARFGMTRQLMINYAVFVTLIKTTLVKSRDMIGTRVRTGEISLDLIKPISLPVMTLADAVGTVIFQIFSRFLPLIIICSLMFDLTIPPGIDIYFFISYLFSFLIFHAILFTFGVASFYIVENFPLWLLNTSCVSLLSGSIIPLEVLPDIVKKIALWTPYPYIFYLPTMKLLKNEYPVDHAILRQLFFVIISYAIGLTLFHFGKRKLQVQGG